MKKIDLQTLSPSDFEEICKEIFEEVYGYKVTRTPYVGDEGRDLILETGSETIYVECKHYLNSSVGRPIVQKLLGEMTTSNVSHGIIITTGYFSKQAVEYVRKNKLNIELIEIHGLQDLARRCGYELVMDSGKEADYYEVPYMNTDLFRYALVSRLGSEIDSVPTHVGDLVGNIRRSSTAIPYVVFSYRIDRDFETGAGIIHSVHTDGEVAVDATSGSSKESQQILDLLNSAEVVEDGGGARGCPRESNRLSSKEVYERAEAAIIEGNSDVIHYIGRNNRSYSKECIPSKKDVIINDLRYVFIPRSHVSFDLAGSYCEMDIMESGNEMYSILKDSYHSCQVCGGMHKKMSVCNDCWTLTGDKCASVCTLCGKTLCSSCTGHYRKYLILKKPACKACLAEMESKKSASKGRPAEKSGISIGKGLLTPYWKKSRKGSQPKIKGLSGVDFHSTFTPYWKKPKKQSKRHLWGER